MVRQEAAALGKPRRALPIRMTTLSAPQRASSLRPSNSMDEGTRQGGARTGWSFGLAMRMTTLSAPHLASSLRPSSSMDEGTRHAGARTGWSFGLAMRAGVYRALQPLDEP